MIELRMSSLKWAVGDMMMLNEAGEEVSGKVLALSDPDSGITVTVPFMPDKAEMLANALVGINVQTAPAMSDAELRRLAGD